MSRDLPYLMALTRIPNIGPVKTKNLIGYCGSAENVFKSKVSHLSKIPNIGPLLASQIKKTDPHDGIEVYQKKLQDKNINVLTYMDDEYPVRLKQIPDSPALLFQMGAATLNAHRMISIVGTRKPSAYGLAQCARIVQGLKEYQVTIVSGLAFGIDACAHRHALNEELPTIAVLGHGLDKIYPAQHRSMARKIVSQGALLTEFHYGSKMEKENFPLRNRIIAGISDAILVVESAVRGGSMITAEFGNAYYKDVFALPGKVSDDMSKGCHSLIKAHKASLIESAEDIAKFLGWEKMDKKQGTQQTLLLDLTDIEWQIVQILKETPNCDIEHLIRKTQLTIQNLATTLLQLEFKGIIKSLPGKRYMLI